MYGRLISWKESILLDVGRFAIFESFLLLADAFIVNRWLSMRFNLLSSVVVGVTGLIVLVTKRVDASLAGFALAFATNVTNDVRDSEYTLQRC